mgnify:CR=1 FL=1
MKQLIAMCIAALCMAGAAHGGDAPQFRGIGREGLFEESGLLKKWPIDGPPVAWVAEGMGAGYSSPAVAGGTIYVTGKGEDGQGYLSLLDLKGKLKKKIPYGPETDERQATGSRGTPTVDGDRVYIISALGVVSCLHMPDGAKMWEVDMTKDFGAELPRWHFAESVLIDGPKAIFTPGSPSAGLVAVNKLTGALIWKSESFSKKASYCAPRAVDHGGRRMILSMTGKAVVGLDGKTGKVLWKYGHTTDYDIHAVAPIYRDGLVYYTAGYGSGGGALKLTADGSGVRPAWRDATLDCQHHGVIPLDGYIYGTGHKQRALICLDMKTGEIAWRANEVSQGMIVYADGMLYVYEGPRKGVVNLVKATPTGFERTGSFTVTQGTGKHWAHPAIANGKLYIRHGDALIAYNIATK